MCELFAGYGIDFYAGGFGQRGYLVADAGRRILREELGIDGVHGGKIGDIGQQNRGFDDVFVTEAGCMVDGRVALIVFIS